MGLACGTVTPLDTKLSMKPEYRRHAFPKMICKYANDGFLDRCSSRPLLR